MPAIVVAAVLAAVGTVTATSSAAAAPTADPTSTALARIAVNTYTAGDLATVRANSTLAAQVPDPAAVTMLGSTIYVWHHKIVDCKTTSKITSGRTATTT